MILEIENMIRSIADICKALLSLGPRAKKAGPVEIKRVEDLNQMANEMEFSARNLDFVLND